jgi:hypothetical protein
MGTGTRLRAPRIASRSLQHLDLRGCGDTIARAAWLALFAACPQLRTLRGFPEALLPDLPQPWAAVTRADGSYDSLVVRAAAVAS